MLTYSAPGMGGRIAQLRERGLPFAPRLPRVLETAGAALLRAPEGTELLLVEVLP